jgi:peptide/nickel transport system permease protein
MSAGLAASPGALRRGAAFVLRAIADQPLGCLGLLVIAAMVVASVAAQRIAPYDPLDVDFASMLAPPSPEHWLGTDSFGRDILSRIIYGARTALTIGFLSAFTGCSLGAIVGISSAYAGGWVDLVVQRLVEILLSFPIIVLALVVVTMLGRSRVWGIDVNLILAIAIPIMPKVSRVMRSAALTIRDLPYVDAARALGFGAPRIVLRHLCPNVAAPYLILLSAYIAQAILLEASLSFLGLGVVEPSPSWGLMLAGNAAQFYREAPWMILFPGLAISLAVFAFNLFGDSLRDWLDPKFRA